MVGRLVRGQRILVTVEPEASSADAVREAPDDAAEVGMRLEVALPVVEAQHHVPHTPVPVRHAQTGQGRAMGEEPDLAA